MLDSLAPQQKSLPHSDESERAVLGGILLDPGVLPTISGRLRPEDFYLDRHQTLYRAMLALQETGVGIDIRTLQARLEQTGHLDSVGGLAYIAGLDLELPDLGRIETYSEIVKERSVRRRLILASGQIIRDCLDGGLVAAEALGRAEQAILGLGEEAIQRGFVALGDVFHATLEGLEDAPGTLLTGVPTGFTDFDRLSHGLNRGNLIIIAGRPGMGKTSFALNVAQHVAIRMKQTVGVFSLEMSQQELALRILCSEADISFSRLRSNRLSQKEWTRIVQTVRQQSDSPLFIDDSANPSLLEVASKARRLKAEKGLSLLVLDYLQLMSAGGRYENRNLEIAAISRGLKQLAKELEIPVIALSQLSRQPERRGADHRPQLADLRESGCLAGGTLVTLADSGNRVPIRDLAGRRDFAVWALHQESLKMEKARVSRAFSTGTKPVFQLTTRLGRSIRATANHKFLTIEGWKRLDTLREGLHLALPRQVGGRPEQTMSDSEVALLGHLLGDGRTFLDAEIGTAHAALSIFKQNLSRERAVRVVVGAQAAALRILSASDIYWDQVASIEEDGVDEVFDLSVPGPHSFVADDLFVHNSIEQDADLVAFIYRDEVYNPTEENRGRAELIIAKHRNGAIETIPLVFIGDTTSFRNFAGNAEADSPPF
jgi:replicative DNA helicase